MCCNNGVIYRENLQGTLDTMQVSLKVLYDTGSIYMVFLANEEKISA